MLVPLPYPICRFAFSPVLPIQSAALLSALSATLLLVTSLICHMPHRKNMLQVDYPCVRLLQSPPGLKGLSSIPLGHRNFAAMQRGGWGRQAAEWELL